MAVEKSVSLTQGASPSGWDERSASNHTSARNFAALVKAHSHANGRSPVPDPATTPIGLRPDGSPIFFDPNRPEGPGNPRPGFVYIPEGPGFGPRPAPSPVPDPATTPIGFRPDGSPIFFDPNRPEGPGNPRPGFVYIPEGPGFGRRPVPSPVPDPATTPIGFRPDGSPIFFDPNRPEGPGNPRPGFVYIPEGPGFGPHPVPSPVPKPRPQPKYARGPEGTYPRHPGLRPVNPSPAPEPRLRSGSQRGVA